MFYSPYLSSTQREFYLDQGCFTYLTEAPYKVGFIWIRDVFQAQYTVKRRVFRPNGESENLINYYVQVMSETDFGEKIKYLKYKQKIA